MKVFQSPGRESQASPPLQPLVHHHAAKKAVVFVVHGMGSQLEGYGKFVQNLAQLRKTCADVLTEEFSASPHAVGVSGEDIAFIPIEWHSLVHGLDSVDSRMNLVTLPTTPIFRQINNDMLADVLYFFSAFHGSKILKIVANVLNTEHQKFMAENPDFSGKICILAHSLGGVISYDLLANQDIATEIFDEKTDTLGKSGDGQAERVRCRTHYEICYPKLNFEPKHVNFLVTIGSQIGPVMIMRGQSPQTYSLPAHIVHRNVFHLYDPMAYRLEPLIDVRYADIAPQPIQRPSATSSLTASATLAFTRVYYQALAAVLGTYTGFTSLAMGGASTSIVEGAQATVAEAAVAAAASSSSAGGASLLGAGPGFLSRAIMPDFEALAARVSAGGVSVAGIVTGGAGAVGAVVPDTFSRAGRVVVEGMVGLTRGLFFEPAAAAADDDTHAAPPDTAPAKRSRARDLRDVGDVAGEEGDGRGRKRRRVNAGQSVTMADDDGQRKIAEPRRSRRSRVRKQPAAHEAGVAASDAVHADAQDAAPNAACPTSPPTVVDGVLDTIRSAVRRVSNALMVFDAESEEAKTEADLLDALSPADSGESQEPATLRSLKRVGRNDSQQVEEVLTEELAAAAERALNRPNDARDKDFAVESRLPSESSSVADDSSGEKPLPLKERLDYFVTETVMDSSVHQYFIGMKAHFSYWTNKDMMYFIVDDLLKDSSPQTETK
ncbi:hypothetical protein HDU83_002234 [Entophlyctis luteolus]|nr:hypothetical protein HDU83_002234 [Entophlyctis luteolus]